MLALVYAPDPIYATVCDPVSAVDDAVRAHLQAMLLLLRTHHAMGLGAPMVGLTQRLVVIEYEDDQGQPHHYQMVNPIITYRSAEMHTMEEASITFLGVAMPVTRAAEVHVEYWDETGAPQTLHATGLLATCVQHEMDYLDGKTILDYQSPMKRDILKRKMEKQKRLHLA
jgi:peptide deformylase